MKNLFASFMVVVVILWLTKLDVFIGKHSLPWFSSALAVMFAGIGVIYLIFIKFRFRYYRPLAIPLLCVFVFSLSVVFTCVYLQDFEYVAEYISYVIYVVDIIFLAVFAREFPRAFLVGVQVGGCVLGVSVLLDAFGIVEYSTKTIGFSRGAGFAENPNSAAASLIVTVLILSLDSKSKKAFLYLAILLPLIATGSRFGMIFIAIFVLREIVNLNYSWRKIAVGVVLVAAVAIFTERLISNLYVHSSMYRRLTFTDSLYNIAEDERSVVAIKYLSYISERPLGRGLEFSKIVPVRAHNTFLNYASDFGVHSSVLYIFSYISFLIFLIRTHKLNRSTFPLILFFLLVPFVNNSIFTLKSFWIFIAHTSVIRRKLKAAGFRNAR